MRRAITHAALTFSLLTSAAGIAQSTSGGSAGGAASGGAPGPVQPQEYYEPGNFTQPPLLAPGTSGGTPMGTIETNTGAEPAAAPPAGATRGSLLEAGTGGSGQAGAPATGAGGTGGPGMNVPSTGTAGTGASDVSGTGGSGVTDTNLGTGGSGSDVSGTATGGGGTPGAGTDGAVGSTGTGGGSGTTTGAGTGRAATGGAPAGSSTSGTASGASAEAPAKGSSRPEDLQQEVARLRDQVQRLEAEVNTLRREDTGTGGSGTQTAPPDADTDSTVLASVVMQGQVASVGKDHVVVRDAESGDTFNLLVTNTTRISANGKRVPPQQLSEGTPVQAAFNYIADGDTYATQIRTYPNRRR
ncbi:hypothetical protein [Corallococcus macrosporus]|uniref:hypothetical protein n=1 Tax=Corallococcus macrosporus TaxID=35 RepID=UPI001EE63F80|nr:hypothetical protein [Corallococcus macrosporus]